MDRIAAEDVEIRGIKVNKGTAVTAAIYVMHRSEDYFENPDDFQPERLNLYNECFPFSLWFVHQENQNKWPFHTGTRPLRLRWFIYSRQ